MESISEKVSETSSEEISDEKEGIANDEDESVSEEVDYQSMTVPQLKEMLKAAGKPVSGKKSDLIERLTGE